MSTSSLPNSIVLMSLLALAALILPAFSTHTNYHHRCKVWKNKCEQHKLHCSEDQSGPLTSCCQPLQENPQEFSGNDSGIYSIRTGAFSSSLGWCDMALGGGGWLVIMRRSSSDINFNRIMWEYEDGFGALDGDFWFGLKALSMLTSRTEYELRVDLFEDSSDTNSSSHAIYSSFKVSGSEYTLNLGQFNGSSDIYDSLHHFNGKPFLAKNSSTEKAGDKCLDYYGFGGWWFGENCLGKSGNPGTILTRSYDELSWYSPSPSDSDSGYSRYFSKYELKIRPKECLSKPSAPSDTSST